MKSYKPNNMTVVILVFALCLSSCLDSITLNRFEFPISDKQQKIQFYQQAEGANLKPLRFSHFNTDFEFSLPHSPEFYNNDYYSIYDERAFPEFSVLEERYQKLLFDQSDKNLISDLIYIFNEFSQKSGYDMIQLIVSFVQNIPYDNHATEVKKPLQTLMMNTGDCDDKSLLLAKILGNMGYKSCLFAYPLNEHMALGLKIKETELGYKDGYVFIETTNLFPIGAIPELFNYQENKNHEIPTVIELDIFGPELEVEGYKELLNYYKNKNIIVQ